mgnify:FL=1
MNFKPFVTPHGGVSYFLRTFTYNMYTLSEVFVYKHPHNCCGNYNQVVDDLYVLNNISTLGTVSRGINKAHVYLYYPCIPNLELLKFVSMKMLGNYVV